MIKLATIPVRFNLELHVILNEGEFYFLRAEDRVPDLEYKECLFSCGCSCNYCYFQILHARNRGSIDTRKTYTKITCHLLLFSLVKSSISVTTQELFSEMKTRQYLKLEPGGGGGWGAAWVNFCWVCAAGFLESLLHYSLLWPNINPILVTFGKM